MLKQRTFILTTLVMLAFLFTLGLLASSALAAPQRQDATPTPQPEGAGEEPPQMQLSISDKVCLGCHGQPGQSLPLGDGSELELYVPAEEHQNSVHGQMGYACVQCHTTVGEYPHPPFSAQDARDASVQLYAACERCHAHQYELAQDSVHARAFLSGNHEAAICTDCHTAHAVRRLNDPETHEMLPDARVWVPQTCARCHSLIYEKYKESVHGSALIGEGNPDVPTCIDCHGVHNIEDPTTAAFRLNSPQICAKCHTDPTVVGKYGLSTNVLDTYVADFHGATQVLFEPKTPDAQFNTPVCYDCHGVHDIARTNDPQHGLQVRENLLIRCQECHPDATANFPEAWMSHYTPSPDTYPIVYYVNLFYKFLIPGVLGGMAILVGMDFSRMSLNRLREWRRRRAAQSGPPREAESQAQDASPGASDQMQTESTDSETNQHG